ncbi:protein artemis isoform X2 [Aplysia californica]|uniref:Protein artemis n=1 Tax=Aplysia californica TaxID=6500 RepID=A0ABM0JNJ7_APLCA|nr:protein artemis isoform X2 [Aplysia californica]
MSCFRGQMHEYREIAIDRFDGGNLRCTAFFLSHCHKDHMVGLSNPAFLDRLSSRKNIFLYCTEVTKLLLLADEEFRCLKNYIQVLQVGFSQPVTVQGINSSEDDYIINVTPISAGHCLGSVMFLFEGHQGTSLYTGDFRWELNQASKMSALHINESVKNIRSMYVDTTFCISEAYHIPSRVQCVEATVGLVSAWLTNSPLHVVTISCPARYGHEHLLVELARQLETKVHVLKWKSDLYAEIPGLESYFSADPNETRIHACSSKGGFPSASRLPCGHHPVKGEKFKIMNIRPSTMWFTSEKTKASAEDLVVAPATQKGLHRVCYSMHSSYSEIRDVVSYLQPERLFPNVLPQSDATMSTVQKRLDSFLKYPHKLRLKTTDCSSGPTFLGELRTLRTVKPFGNLPDTQASDSPDDLVFSSPDSPLKRPVPTAKNPRGVRNLNSLFGKQASPESPKSSASAVHSSYEGSDRNEEELDIAIEDVEAPKEMDCLCSGKEEEKREDEKNEDEESFRLYVSGESDVCDDDEEDEQENDFSEYKIQFFQIADEVSKSVLKSSKWDAGSSSFVDDLSKGKVESSGKMKRKFHVSIDTQCEKSNTESKCSNETDVCKVSDGDHEEKEPKKSDHVSLQTVLTLSERKHPDINEDLNSSVQEESDEDFIPNSQEGKDLSYALCLGRRDSPSLPQNELAEEVEDEDSSHSEPLLVNSYSSKKGTDGTLGDVCKHSDKGNSVNCPDEDVISIKSSEEMNDSNATQSYNCDFLTVKESFSVTEEAAFTPVKDKDEINKSLKESSSPLVVHSEVDKSCSSTVQVEEENCFNCEKRDVHVVSSRKTKLKENDYNCNKSGAKTISGNSNSTPQRLSERALKPEGLGERQDGEKYKGVVRKKSLLSSPPPSSSSLQACLRERSVSVLVSEDVIHVDDAQDDDIEYLFDEKPETEQNQEAVNGSDGWMSKQSNQQKGIPHTFSLKRRSSPVTCGKRTDKKQRKVTGGMPGQEVVDLTDDL